MQSRHTLPGWYGLGSAVHDYLTTQAGDLAMLQAMYQRWAFWRTLIDNAQMILAKADLTIARLYADLVDDQDAGRRASSSASRTNTSAPSRRSARSRAKRRCWKTFPSSSARSSAAIPTSIP